MLLFSHETDTPMVGRRYKMPDDFDPDDYAGWFDDNGVYHN